MYHFVKIQLNWVVGALNTQNLFPLFYLATEGSATFETPWPAAGRPSDGSMSTALNNVMAGPPKTFGHPAEKAAKNSFLFRKVGSRTQGPEE